MEDIKAMTLGELREATKDLPDDTKLMVAHGTEAYPLSDYHFCTNIDYEGGYLFGFDNSQSVEIEMC